ncbi:MAG: type III pantothenate kinase [Ruminococcus sp.]|nr:type III pantothenate kinase [Ruminococcus sp.]
MLLCTDVGNTHIKFALYEGKKQLVKFKFSTNPGKTEDEFAAELHVTFNINGYDPKDIKGSIISSVVPRITEALCKAIRKIAGVNTLVLGPGVKSGLDLRIDNPATLGTDLLAMCVAAKEMYPCPSIIIGLGTATTIVYLDSQKRYCGGTISPGVSISLDALTNNGALLPSVDLNPPKKVIGTNTEDCIRSGLIIGTACMLDGMIERFNEEKEKAKTVIATGGLAQSIVKNCKCDIIINDDLILDGLRIIFWKNSSNSQCAMRNAQL